MKIDFCLPVRNEEKILADNVKRLRNFLIAQHYLFDWQVVIIVNGSEDASAKIARELEGDHVSSKTISTEGKGVALKTGFQESTADILVFMDVDLAVSLDNIQSLIDGIIDENYDLVIGSRLLPQSHTSRSGLRDLNSRLYNLLSRIVLQHNLSDLQCGFKAIKKNIFNEAKPFLRDNQWFFDTELVMVTQYLGYKVKEIPVDWQENRYDERKSKVKVLRDAWPFIINLFRLRKRLA